MKEHSPAVQNQGGLEVVPASQLEVVQNAYPPQHQRVYNDHEKAKPAIFGLQRPTFILALLLALAVAATAVIGGVLGSRLASKW